MTDAPSYRLALRHPALAPCGPDVDAAFRVLVESFAAGGKLLLCGNGGSAADCDHLAAELMKGFAHPRLVPAAHREALLQFGGARGAAVGARLQGALPALPLTGAGALATAIGNDIGEAMAFAQQVYGLGVPGDVLLGISTSGQAENVLNAFVVGRLRGLRTVALTGRSGGALAPLADVAIRVPADTTAEIQELHLPVYHALCLALEAHFFPLEPKAPPPV